MNDSEARITRMLQAAAVLTTSGHMRQDAVLTALSLEKEIIEQVKKDKTQGDPECQKA
jgi:hypothetical protein